MTARSDSYLQSILNAFKDLIFVFNRDGVILDYLKEENSEWLYVPKEQFIGKHHRDVLPPHVSSKIEVAISEIMRGRNKSTFDYNLLINRRLAWFSAVFSPLDEGRTTSKCLCVIREITERKENELLLKGVLENSSNAFIFLQAIRNAEGQMEDFEWVLINHQAEELIGKTVEDLVHKRVRESNDQPWIMLDKYINVVETGKDLEVEHSYIKNQSREWLLSHVSRLEDGVVIAIKNITEKKQAELALKLYNQQMDLFFEQSLTGFFFMMLDEPVIWDETTDKAATIDYALDHLHFTRFNDALLRQYGLTAEQFKTRPLRDFFGKDVEKGKALFHRLYEEKHIHINRVTQKADGTELWIEGDYICFTDDQGRILGHFGTQRDVTERKHAEESLVASEERYRLLADNTMDLVALHDQDGTYKYVSPSVTTLLGYSPEELLGTNPYKLFHPDDIPFIQKQSHDKAKEGEQIFSIEYRIRKKDGQYIWFSTSTKPIKDNTGNVTMLQTVSRDVTEKVETLHLLEQLNHQKNKLFSIIAHDLRGPVANCMGLLHLLRQKPTENNVQKYLKLLQKSAGNIYDLMEDLLMWASNQLDKTTYEPVELNLENEISSVVRTFSEMAQSKNITVNNVINNHPHSVYGDKNMVRTILRNLITNAIKFTNPGGHIEILANRNNDWIEVSVKDTGTGIRKEDIEKLFSKSSTFTTYGTGGEKGTGLGLDICKDFVEKHGGKIWVESELGIGSKFTFTLHPF